MSDELARLQRELARVRRENDLLRGIVGASKDALWCIEFADPVDLTAPEPEIIRQVFENESHWRLCNRAMARLYKLPEDQDFNAQNVRFVFPRNPENEDFVRTLLANDFDIDGAPSLDQTYENEWVYAENDVRAHIENGRLHRMWGAVRNLSRHKKRERELSERLDSLVNVLSAVADPVLVVSPDGVVQAANPALEWAFGWRVDDVLGRPVGDLVAFPEDFDGLDGAPGPGERSLAVRVSVASRNGRERPCTAFIAAFGNAGSDRRMVVTLGGLADVAADGASSAGVSSVLGVG